MTERNELHLIKTIAKRLARIRRIAHHEALNLIASELDFPHWRALTVALEKGWRPSPSQIKIAEGLLTAIYPNAMATDGSEHNLTITFAGEEQGYIDGHPYWLSIDFEVLMQGRGWAIYVGEAPSEKPQIMVTDRRFKANPILNPEFVAKALEVAQAAAEKLRARIASDWPRRSTKPDAEGRARHPLFSQLSNEWHCLHCDGEFTGDQMAENMWHCPKCSATPIDIFVAPFWKAAS
jgi:hypothetical protein